MYEKLQHLERFLDRPGFPWREFITTFIIGQFVFESCLAMRQYSVLQRTRPPAVLEKELSPTVFAKTQAYGRAKAQFNLVAGFLAMVQSVAFVQLQLFSRFWVWSGQVLPREGAFSGEISQSVVFLLSLLLVQQIMSQPASLYQVFYLEDRFGFNKQTAGLYVADLLKMNALAVVLAPPVVAGFLAIVNRTGSQFFYFLWLFCAALQLFTITIYPIVILPLFNKLAPLQEGDLKTRVEALARRLSFPLHELYVIDGSRRSAHSNAYFFGLPWKKHIVIYDTLIEKSTAEEVVAVLAHELGHWKMGHTTRLIAIAQAHLFSIFFLFSLFINNGSLYEAFDFVHERPVIIGFLLFSDILAPTDAIIKLGMNVVTRRYEFQADRFAKDLGLAHDLARSLIKLHVQNLASMDSDWMYSAYHASHPHLSERLKAVGWTSEGAPVAGGEAAAAGEEREKAVTIGEKEL